MERDMKKIHLNLPGDITHVCMTLTRTARMAESQLGTQMLPLWSDPLSICSGKPHRAAAERLHKRGWYYRVTTSPIPGLSEKNLKPIHFPSDRFLKFGPFILPSNILTSISCPWISLFSIQTQRRIEMSSTAWSFHMFVLSLLRTSLISLSFLSIFVTNNLAKLTCKNDLNSVP